MENLPEGSNRYVVVSDESDKTTPLWQKIAQATRWSRGFLPVSTTAKATVIAGCSEMAKNDGNCSLTSRSPNQQSSQNRLYVPDLPTVTYTPMQKHTFRDWMAYQNWELLSSDTWQKIGPEDI